MLYHLMKNNTVMCYSIHYFSQTHHKMNQSFCFSPITRPKKIRILTWKLLNIRAFNRTAFKLLKKTKNLDKKTIMQSPLHLLFQYFSQ